MKLKSLFTTSVEDCIKRIPQEEMLLQLHTMYIQREQVKKKSMNAITCDLT